MAYHIHQVQSLSADLTVYPTRVGEVVADLAGHGVIDHVLERSRSVLLWLDINGEGGFRTR